MASNDAVKLANMRLSTTLPMGFTAVFFGATSGIGLSALKQLVAATNNKNPRIYVVGRSAAAAVPMLAELRQSNESAHISFIERDVSLVKNVDLAVAEIQKTEDKLDLLFMSVGFMSFEGRKETTEGLEPSMTTRYYSRVRAIQLFLPLLVRSQDPHVTNILAGGEEGPLLKDDLDLARPGNYSVKSGSVHSCTMLTLSLERFASENPRVSFVHAFPGLTATPLLTRGSSGLLGLVLSWIVTPLVTLLLAASVDSVGARALFYSTNARYSVPESSDFTTPIPDKLSRASQTEGGVFLVGAKGETPNNEELLRDIRKTSAQNVWKHTAEIFERVLK